MQLLEQNPVYVLEKVAIITFHNQQAEFGKGLFIILFFKTHYNIKEALTNLK